MRNPIRLVGEMELAWAAGFFDGEGWTGTYQAEGKQSVDLRMHVTQTDKDVLERFRVAVGCGMVEPLKRRKNRKQAWRWRVRGQEVVDVAAKLHDLLCQPKQDQMVTAIGRRLAYEEIASAKDRSRNSGHSRLRLVS